MVKVMLCCLRPLRCSSGFSFLQKFHGCDLWTVVYSNNISYCVLTNFPVHNSQEIFDLGQMHIDYMHCVICSSSCCYKSSSIQLTSLKLHWSLSYVARRLYRMCSISTENQVMTIYSFLAQAFVNYHSVENSEQLV